MGGVLLIMAMIFVAAPIARAIARSIERGGRPLADRGREEELRRALQAAEQRLTESETRLGTLEERVDFYEKLLAAPRTPTPPKLEN